MNPRLPPTVMATANPSSILRAPDEQTRQLQWKAFVDDLKKIKRQFQKSAEAA